MKKKTISRVGNVTCAAAALRCGAIIKEEEFWKKLQEGKICEMDEYKNHLMFF